MKATEKKILLLLVQGMSNKELIDAIASSAKLTKADAGRLVKVFEVMPSKADAARMMACMPEKELIDFLFGMKKVELIDAISAGAKLTKADAGRALDRTIELIHKKVRTDSGGKE